jgi:hypothetical protein
VEWDSLLHPARLRSSQGTVRLGGSVVWSLVFVVPDVTRLGTGRFWCAFGVICLCERGDAGLVPAVGLIRSLSAFCRA